MRTDRKKFEITQALILCGGQGSRLGSLTKKIPKPLLKVGSKKFLDYVIINLARHGIKKILMLCGYKSKLFYKKYNNKKILDAKIKCIKENDFLGTGGAIVNARNYLEKKFIVCNGDTYFNFNLREFLNKYDQTFDGCLAIVNPKNKKLRYDRVLSKKGIVYKISKSLISKYINTGYYIFSKKIFQKLKRKKISLENTILTDLIKKKNLQSVKFNNFSFIDIGIPHDFVKAQKIIPKNFKKKAAFLDRDGVINKDLGYVIKKKNFIWNKGVKEGIKLLNNNNYYVFVITNQSGVGRGYFSEKELNKLHFWINKELNKYDAHIDYFYYATYFKESKQKKYQLGKNLRKPNTGMIKLANKNWSLDLKNSFLIGDKFTDIEVAKKLKIKSYLVKKNFNFLLLVKKLILKQHK